jgi:lysophospholipase L1-like esterase
MLKQRLATTLLLLVSLAIGGVAVELVLRHQVGLPPRRLAPQVRYDPHPVRRFTLRPSQSAYTYDARVRVDSDAFRVNGNPERSHARTRVFALGDSETWPAQLESLLNARLPGGVRVVNGGIVSYGAFQELDLLRERGLKTRPDIVIHALYWNDYMSPGPGRPGDPPVLTPDGQFVWERDPGPTGIVGRIGRWVIARSALAWAVWDAISRLRDRRPDVSGYAAAYRRLVAGSLAADEWRPVEDFYRQFQQLGDSAGFIPYVVILPVSDIVRGSGLMTHPYRRYVRGLLDRLGISYLDCFAVWKALGLGRATFLSEGPDAHLSARGYRILADALAQALWDDSTVVVRLKSSAGLQSSPGERAYRGPFCDSRCSSDLASHARTYGSLAATNAAASARFPSGLK